MVEQQGGHWVWVEEQVVAEMHRRRLALDLTTPAPTLHVFREKIRSMCEGRTPF
jgi:hypothetical protein